MSIASIAFTGTLVTQRASGLSAATLAPVSSLSRATPSDEAVDKAFAELLKGSTPEEMLAEITADGIRGYWKWQVKEMQKKAAAQVMGEMGVTAESIHAMPASQRIDIERKIMEIVEERVREMLAAQAMKDRTPSSPAASGGAMLDMFA